MNYTAIKTYGTAKKYRVNKNVLKGLLVFLCIVTPFTNWLIPFINKIVTKDLFMIIRRG